VLIVDDEVVQAAALQEVLQGEGYEVAIAHDAESALALVATFEPEVALCDVQLPGADGLEFLDRLLRLRPETLTIMITAFATVENAVAAFRRGAHDYIMKPVILDDLSQKVARLVGFRRLSMENQTLRRQLHGEAELDAFVGRSPALRAVKTLIRKVGPARSNVLIMGESGTGKELVARALHSLGPDPDAVFLAVNAAAIPHDLLENQLFGHVRGAFTGADRDHAGLFVAAGGGTVFLDEIGELSPATQAKLLRAIETKEVLPVGGTRPIRVAARVLAATNKDLAAEVAAGRFRADLFYRLNVVSIQLPPLRDRREDIPELVEVLLARQARQLGKRVDGVDNATIRGLMAAAWKGNVRELENALERAVILSDGPILSPEHFPPGLIAPEGDPADAPGEPGDDLRTALRSYERQHIRQVLDCCQDDKREAARRLGLGLSSLYRKLEELGLR
jgi:DNA-binding NtrC family response regulator